MHKTKTSYKLQNSVRISYISLSMNVIIRLTYSIEWRKRLS